MVITRQTLRRNKKLRRLNLALKYNVWDLKNVQSAVNERLQRAAEKYTQLRKQMKSLVKRKSSSASQWLNLHTLIGHTNCQLNSEFVQAMEDLYCLKVGLDQWTQELNKVVYGEDNQK